MVGKTLQEAKPVPVAPKHLWLVAVIGFLQVVVALTTYTGDKVFNNILLLLFGCILYWIGNKYGGMKAMDRETFGLRKKLMLWLVGFLLFCLVAFFFYKP